MPQVRSKNATQMQMICQLILYVGEQTPRLILPTWINRNANGAYPDVSRMAEAKMRLIEMCLAMSDHEQARIIYGHNTEAGRLRSFLEAQQR